jgi:hypothetical protein
MFHKLSPIGYVLVVCVSLSAGCVWAPMLSNQWGENFALASYGAAANAPAINDGNLDTVGVVRSVEGERVFTLKFNEVKPVNKIIIHNKNLYRFNVDYLNPETGEWVTFHEVRQRRDIGKERYQAKYEIDRLNFQTNAIRIFVLRTVDDSVTSTGSVNPDDKVMNQVRGSHGGRYVEYYRVLNPSAASIREIEVYHLTAK